LFVKLDDTGADGFIPARTIGSEYFRYQEDAHALIGNSSGETYRLGDRISVRLVEAVAVAGALRFEILSEGRSGTPLKRSPRSSRGRARGKQREAEQRPGRAPVRKRRR
jgi:ribonuclease R